MSLKVPDYVNADGNIDVLDRVGCVIHITATNLNGDVNISADNVYFECGTIKKLLEAEGIGKKLTLLPSELYQLKASGETNFSVINESKTPFDEMWQGLIFIRTVD